MVTCGEEEFVPAAMSVERGVAEAISHEWMSKLHDSGSYDTIDAVALPKRLLEARTAAATKEEAAAKMIIFLRDEEDDSYGIDFFKAHNEMNYSKHRNK